MMSSGVALSGETRLGAEGVCAGDRLLHSRVCALPAFCFVFGGVYNLSDKCVRVCVWVCLCATLKLR